MKIRDFFPPLETEPMETDPHAARFLLEVFSRCFICLLAVMQRAVEDKDHYKLHAMVLEFLDFVERYNGEANEHDTTIEPTIPNAPSVH